MPNSTSNKSNSKNIHKPEGDNKEPNPIIHSGVDSFGGDGEATTNSPTESLGSEILEGVEGGVEEAGEELAAELIG